MPLLLYSFLCVFILIKGGCIAINCNSFLKHKYNKDATKDIQMYEAMIDVVSHELTHFIEGDHGSRFNYYQAQICAEFMPRFHERMKKLGLV